MIEYFEIFGIVLLATAGFSASLGISRLPGKYWLVGYVVCMTLVVMIGLSRYFPVIGFIKPFSWLVAGRAEFAIYAVIATMPFSILLPKLPDKRLRGLITIFIVLVTIKYSLLPFLGPILVRGELKNLETKFDVDDCCIQGTDYTCGPAAAVTALKRLGVKAQEGEIAIWAHTNQFSGTPEDVLWETLQRHFSKDGVKFEYRMFDSLEELKREGLTLAVIKHSFIVDHYITILEVNGEKVIAADPLRGKIETSHADFEKIWRYSGITVKKTTELDLAEDSTLKRNQ